MSNFVPNGIKQKMNLIPDQIRWTFIRRILIAYKVRGFGAHWNTYADPSCVFSPYNRVYKNSKLIHAELGKFTYIAGASLGEVKVGAFCSIGPMAIVGGLGKHPTSFLSTHPAFYSTQKQAGETFCEQQLFAEQSTTQVGNDVWVGAHAIILDGLRIGDGAIIGAGAIVTKDVPAYAVVAGVPAKIIRYRFEDTVIKSLEEWQWWDLPDETLKRIHLDFSADKLWTKNEIEKIKTKISNLM